MSNAQNSLLTVDARTKKRNAAETRFKAYGLGAILIAMLALLILLTSVLETGLSAFRQTFITIEVSLPEAKLDKTRAGDRSMLRSMSRAKSA